MTPEQLATLKTHILANQDTAALYNDGNLSGLADALNAPSDPAYIVWRTSVTQDEIMQNGFDWTRVDNLSVGPARVWEWMFQNEARSINPSKVNVRAGIEAVWKGVAADLAVRAAVYVHCKRTASRFEQLFASGTGSTAVPGTMTLEGPLGYFDLIGL